MADWLRVLVGVVVLAACSEPAPTSRPSPPSPPRSTAQPEPPDRPRTRSSSSAREAPAPVRRDEASLDVLRQALGSDDYATRLIAIEALGDVRLAEATEWLGHALGDPEHDVRMAAVESLRRAPGMRAEDLLRTVRDDAAEELDIRALAAAALLSRSAR